MRYKWAILVMVGAMVWATPTLAHEVAFDSLRVELQGGNRFVIHQVESGETLYGLARRYQVSQGDIMKANPELAQGLKVNQLVKIPLGKDTSDPGEGKVHTVAPGETLFSLSQKYDVEVSDIKKWNNLTSNSLAIGQELMLYGGNEETPATPTRPSQTTQGGNSSSAGTATNASTHTVQPDETLYSISRKYAVSVEQIRKWNGLPDNNISIGQQLSIGKTAPATPTTPATNTNANDEVEVTYTRPPANTTTTPPANTTTTPANTQTNTPTPVRQAPTTTPNSGMPTRVSESVLELGQDDENSTGFKKVSEQGLCEVIEGSGETKKYLAMHRTAPIGTIMEVRNEMNDILVFVRVVAHLPDTGDNEKLLLKISQAAYERLGGVDKRFPVEIAYIP